MADFRVQTQTQGGGLLVLKDESDFFSYIESRIRAEGLELLNTLKEEARDRHDASRER